MQNRIEGNLEKGAEVVMLDDTVQLEDLQCRRLKP